MGLNSPSLYKRKVITYISLELLFLASVEGPKVWLKRLKGKHIGLFQSLVYLTMVDIRIYLASNSGEIIVGKV